MPPSSMKISLIVLATRRREALFDDMLSGGNDIQYRWVLAGDWLGWGSAGKKRPSEEIERLRR